MAKRARKSDAPPDAPQGVDVRGDRPFHRRNWAFERAGWAVLAALLLAAVLGVFGSGPLSWTEARTADGTVLVRFERFMRLYGNESMTVEIEASGATGDAIDLFIARPYLQLMEIQHIVPSPSEQRFVPDGAILTFPRDPASGRVEVVFHFRAHRLGKAASEVGLARGQRVRFWQFVYP